MRRLFRLFSIALVATTLFIWAGRATWRSGDPPEVQREISAKTLADLPLAFVPNAGQSHPAVRYQVHAWQGGTLFFEDEGLTLAIPDGPAMVNDGGPSKIGLPELEPALQGSVTAIGLSFVGANAEPRIEAGARLPGHVSYIQGNDPEGWQPRLPSHDSVTYRQLYPGIDLRYDGQGGTFKGTWLVAPGADPRRIAWRYEGAADVEMDREKGDLLITLPVAGKPERANAGRGDLRQLIEAAPLSWQVRDGKRVPVASDFTLDEDGTVRFRIGEYDAALPLVVDPTLLFASYLGGGSRDWGYDIELDPSNNIYVGGGTASVDFPTQSPLQAARGRTSHGFFLADAFISKLSPDGQTLLYSTYLGGNEGGDVGQSIAVDDAGSVAITGETHAADFPVMNAFQAAKAGRPVLPSPAEGEGFDGYVARLSPDGSQLLFGSFYGGDGREEPQSIAYGPDGDLYITGHTLAPDLPLVKPLQAAYGGSHEGFAARIDGEDYSLLWSTYIGGSSSDMGWGIAVDASGHAWVAGSTSSLDFPTANAVQPAIGSSPNRTQESDMFLMRITPDGQQAVFSTYMGGIGEDRAIGVAIQSNGDAVFTGMSGNPGDFPLVKPIQSDYEGRARNAVVLKLSPDGQTVHYATFLGHSGDDWGVDVDIDGNDNAWVVGRTTSAEFPVRDPIQNQIAGANDTFVAALTPDGQQLFFSTWIGGSDHDMGLGMAVRDDGTAHVTGWTGSVDYPLVQPLQAAPAGGNEAFIAQIGEVDQPPTQVPPAPSATPTPTTMPPTPTMTATSPPAPSATPELGGCVCDIVRRRVPAAVIAAAMANPDQIDGWDQLLDPNKPEGPFNPRRQCLGLLNEAVPYHPLMNGLRFKAGCH